jgi:hypothetical protein
MHVPPMSYRKHTATAVAAIALAALAATGSSCATDLNGTEINACPDADLYKQNVSPFMERRCGTLDCHGGISRPMRLYGQLGLRTLDENNTAGGLPTTEAELSANYSAVCNLDPEKMTESVMNLGNSAGELLILRKARGLEKHKGGKVVNEGDHGDACILTWLKGNPNDTDLLVSECAAEVKQLK